MHRFPHEFDPEAQVHAELNVHSSSGGQEGEETGTGKQQQQ